MIVRLLSFCGWQEGGESQTSRRVPHINHHEKTALSSFKNECPIINLNSPPINLKGDLKMRIIYHPEEIVTVICK